MDYGKLGVEQGVVGGGELELASGQGTLLEEYLDQFGSLIGDRRTGRAFRGIVQGILGAESLVCARIATFSP